MEINSKKYKFLYIRCLCITKCRCHLPSNLSVHFFELSYPSSNSYRPFPDGQYYNEDPGSLFLKAQKVL